MREGIKRQKGPLYLPLLRAFAFPRSTTHIQCDANQNSAPSKYDNCSVPEVSFCRPVYLQPRCGVLATKESLLRLWCDLGARQPFIWRRATRAGTPTCEASQSPPPPLRLAWRRRPPSWAAAAMRLRGSPVSKITMPFGARARLSSWPPIHLTPYASIFPKGPTYNFFLSDCSS